MRYVIPSLGRAATQKTLESLPPGLLPHIELMVVPSDYADYKNQWYSDKVKSIECWPEYIDMMPKKRKWLAQNMGDDFLMLDDDLLLYAWNKTDLRYNRARDLPKAFTRRFLETIPAYFETHSMVSVPMKFMSDVYHKEKGIERTDIGYVVTGMRKDAAAKVVFNTVFAFTDVSVPLQVYQAHKTAVVYYGLCFSQSKSKDNAITGMNSYRTPFIKADSAIKMLQLFPGIITDFYETKDQGGGGIGLSKRTSRILKGCTKAAFLQTKTNLEKWLLHYGLSKPPAHFQYEDEMPRAEIIAQLKRNWKAAK